MNQNLFLSAYCLRTGVSDYCDYILELEGSGVMIGYPIMKNNLTSILKACDQAARMILDTLRAVDGSRNVEIKVNDNCKLWLETF